MLYESDLIGFSSSLASPEDEFHLLALTPPPPPPPERCVLFFSAVLVGLKIVFEFQQL